VKRVASILAYLWFHTWASPGTALGFALGGTSMTRGRIRGGVVVYTGKRGFPALHRKLGFRAITLGHVVIASEPLDDELWRHELAHVRQWEIFGPFMFIAYPLASIAGYRRNPFEVAARRRAGA
jgi:hypothetical protein